MLNYCIFILCINSRGSLLFNAGIFVKIDFHATFCTPFVNCTQSLQARPG